MKNNIRHYLKALVFLSSGVAAAVLPKPLSATQITFTVAGTVENGIDETAVFGLAPGTSLVGLPFKLVYTFDDQKGAQNILTFNGIPYSSSVTGSGSNSPGVATIYIGGGSFTFGGSPAEYPDTVVSSTATRITRDGNATSTNSADEDVEDFLGAPGVFVHNEVNASVYVQTGGPAMTDDYDWRGSLVYTLTAFDKISSQGSFQVSTPTQDAWGVLNMNTLTISGISNTSSAPEPAAYGLLGVGFLGLCLARYVRKQ
ncbi:MAG: hypothetical protein JO051_08275 [Acidobacteriaceae bacterium]|nr:hypothetical protein [Acidobacteriaceae bacterium]